MTLKQTLQEVDRLNKLGGEWQYVAYNKAEYGNCLCHILLIPEKDNQYSLETTPVGGCDRHAVPVPYEMAITGLADLPERWVIWKWLPNEERRIFKPAEETMIDAR